MSFLVSELDLVVKVTDFIWMYIKSLYFLTFSQRWVSEKLSVESLRDLELFGGEFSRPASHAAVLLVPFSADLTPA